MDEFFAIPQTKYIQLWCIQKYVDFLTFKIYNKKVSNLLLMSLSFQIKFSNVFLREV